MPELPEVETTCRGIASHIVNNTITHVQVRDKRLRWPVPVQVLKKQLLNQRIKRVARRAKYILIHLETGTLIIHLGMSGTLRLFDKATTIKKHDHVELEFADGKILRLNDPRRFGAVLFSDDYTQHDLFSHLGPEPLSDDFSGAYLLHKAQKRKTPIKTFIMDQQIVVGVGNIYASESLFKAKIHPLMPTHQLTLKQAKALYLAIQEILRAAIKKGGTSLKDFYQSDGKPGYFATQLAVYDRQDLPCMRCQTAIIAIRVGQRSTYYCPSCQRV